MRTFLYMVFVAFLVGSAVAKDLTLSDPALTPGVSRVLSIKKICTIKWGRDVRHVTTAMKKQVFAEYGLTENDEASCVEDASGRRCEVDHLLSRELGGADDVKNLWPQPYGSKPWNVVLKDRVENRLHKKVRAKAISLSEARKEIKTDWRVPYKRYFGTP